MSLFPSQSPPRGWDAETISVPSKKNQLTDIGAYFSATVFLLAVFFTAQAFSFDYFHEKIEKVSLSVSRGKEIVLDQTTRNIFPGVILGLEETSSLLLSGASEGLKLSQANLLLCQNTIKNFLGQAFTSSKVAVLDNLLLANKKITTVTASAIATGNETLASVKSESIASSSFLNWLYQTSFITAIFSFYNSQVLPIRDLFNQGIVSMINFKDSLVDSASLSWHKFFSQISGVGGAGDVSDLSAREQLKQEILQELRGGDTATIKPGNVDSLYTDSGIVLLKQTGSTTIDLNNVKKMQDSFSDRILVNFDQVGETGVIQPIFRDRVGEKYFFVITPVKK